MWWRVSIDHWFTSARIRTPNFLHKKSALLLIQPPRLVALNPMVCRFREVLLYILCVYVCLLRSLDRGRRYWRLPSLPEVPRPPAWRRNLFTPLSLISFCYLLFVLCSFVPLNCSCHLYNYIQTCMYVYIYTYTYTYTHSDFQAR